uniref:Uncharacterized protein n=1 Tax=Aegilops tauschii subsp. strangulata TaxID=200361 RepID=A0A453AP20_AEGTS
MRKPVFTTIDKLLPQTHDHTLTARVLSARPPPAPASPSASSATPPAPSSSPPATTRGSARLIPPSPVSSVLLCLPPEDKGVMANQGAWCSQATNGGCLTSARRRRTGTDGGQSTSLLPG